MKSGWKKLKCVDCKKEFLCYKPMPGIKFDLCLRCNRGNWGKTALHQTPKVVYGDTLEPNLDAWL